MHFGDINGEIPSAVPSEINEMKFKNMGSLKNFFMRSYYTVVVVEILAHFYLVLKYQVQISSQIFNSHNRDESTKNLVVVLGIFTRKMY